MLEMSHSSLWQLGSALLFGMLVTYTAMTLTSGGNVRLEPPGSEGAGSLRVEIVRVVAGPVHETVTAVGTLEANEAVVIRPEMAGLVTRVHFTDGQSVKRGQLLVELDDTELQTQARQAAAQLKIARLTYHRMTRLFASKSTVVSPQQVDEALSQLQSAEAAHALYVTRAQKTRIAAPFDGTLGIRRFSPGAYVQPGQDLVNLEDLSVINLDFKVPEIYLSRLAVGQSLQCKTEAYPNEIFEGTVAALDPRVDSLNRAIQVRARLPNPGGKLEPGLFATVTLMLGTNEQAHLIPEEAVIHQGDRTFVYRMVDETARWTEVTLGVRDRGLVHVVSGLALGEIVVRTGQHKLRDGLRITATAIPPHTS